MSDSRFRALFTRNGVLDWTCNACGETFTSAEYLPLHAWIMHAVRDDRPTFDGEGDAR